MKKANTAYENEGILETMFRVPASDKTFIHKLKEYSTDRITRVRRYGQRPKDPTKRGSSGYVRVPDATWFSVMLDDEMVERERTRAREADKKYMETLRLYTKATNESEGRRTQLESTLKTVENLEADLEGLKSTQAFDLECMHKSYVENVESIEQGRIRWIVGCCIVTLGTIAAAIWALEGFLL